MIKIDNVTKKYNNLTVLSELTLNIKESEIHGVIGKSGSGKSTLLRTINGLEAIDKGSISVDGKRLDRLNEKKIRDLRKDIGMIFQNFALLQRRNVFNNVAFPLKCWKFPKDEINYRVHRLLELVDLTEKTNEMPASLSGGQSQRVAIAKALALQPKVLLSDEATSGLDPKSTENIVNLMLKINKEFNITMVIVTHEMDVIQKLCDNVSVLKKGKIVATGKVEDLMLSFNEHLTDFTVQKNYKINDNKVAVRVLSFIDHKNITKNDFLSNLNNELEFNLIDAQFIELKNGQIKDYTIVFDEKDRDVLEKNIKLNDDLSYKYIKKVDMSNEY